MGRCVSGWVGRWVGLGVYAHECVRVQGHSLEWLIVESIVVETNTIYISGMETYFFMETWNAEQYCLNDIWNYNIVALIYYIIIILLLLYPSYQ
jgi:hypothetical protein